MQAIDQRETVSRAERAVRRGDFATALETFERLVNDNPEEASLRQRRDAIRELAQSGELGAGGGAVDEGPAATGQLTPAEEGERHASAGRFDQAAESYRLAVEQNPGSELLRERYQELVQLAPPSESATPHVAAESIETPTSVAAVKPDADPLPGTIHEALQELLMRIAQNRRA